ncbi:hypothetical protein PT300_13410 [Enterobacteriaceae bacterium ESL0689]|nr:hypothetical protein [Enterobacteriaceae bacterium ESL0689]
MDVPDQLILGLTNSTRPVLIYRNKRGEAIFGCVLLEDQFIASMPQILETLKMAGLKVVIDPPNSL